MPVDPDGIPIMEEAPEELLVDFGKVPQSKSRSEFEDSLYPVSVADHNQISDATSKLLHRLHYDPYDEDEAELRFLHSKPTCFIILGKPGSGKTDLAKKLADEWKCQMVSAGTVIQESMDMETDVGLKVQELLLRGESVPEEMAAKMIEDKINSPEVIHHGYVLDGFPSTCEDYLSINNQLELIKNWKMKPDFIINLKIPDNDLENRRLGQKVDPMTGEIYTREVYDPDKPEPVQKEPEDEGDEEREDGEEEAEPEAEEEPILPILPPEIIKRLVKRPEDMEAFVPDNIKMYKSNMLRLLEDYMADHNQQYLLELDANKPSHVLLRELMLQLDTFVLRPAAVPLRLQDVEDEELPEDMDTDELLRTFAPKQMVAPRFRWRRSRWLRNCPVALADGSIVAGKPEYAVSFLDKMYVMSNDLAMAKFLKNPRPFLLPPQPRPPCKLVVLGPQLSGKTTVAYLLALRYSATVLDIDMLVMPRYEEEWKRKIETARDNAAAAATELLKSKLAEAAEKERRRLETADVIDAPIRNE
ncbi:Adenylate kinase 9 [Lamellibrachia satsuma]|nr:Adenylate kinase 9 [Lamellibrachia satsuma]